MSVATKIKEENLKIGDVVFLNGEDGYELGLFIFLETLKKFEIPDGDNDEAVVSRCISCFFLWNKNLSSMERGLTSFDILVGDNLYLLA